MRPFGWSRWSIFYTGGIFITLSVVIVHWWPVLARFFWWWKPGSPFWLQVDGLLVITLALLFLLVTRDADIKADRWVLVVGLAGGVALESWGSGTGLWTYFTGERPPLWILPAWPIASLAIDRASRLLIGRFDLRRLRRPALLYGLAFSTYVVVLLLFVWRNLDSLLTQAAVLLQLYIILTPRDMRQHLVYFAAGATVGCLLELWGTTRLCWTYYTGQTPPLFAVLAHGMAAVAFSRAAEFLRSLSRAKGRAVFPGRIFGSEALSRSVRSFKEG